MNALKIAAVAASALALVACNATKEISTVHDDCSTKGTIADVTSCWEGYMKESNSITVQLKATGKELREGVAAGRMSDADAIDFWDTNVVVWLFEVAEARDQQSRQAMARGLNQMSQQAHERSLAWTAASRSNRQDCTSRISGNTVRTSCY